MKTVRIDFNKMNPLVDGFVVGRIGEHNATKLLITPPTEMQSNGDISFYYVAFETGGKVYHSERIEKADTIVVSLWKQLTENKTLSVQVEGCSKDESILEKSVLLTGLCFLPSVCGEKVDINCEGTQAITKGVEFVETAYGNVSEAIVYGVFPSNILKTTSYLKKITLIDVNSLPFRAFDLQTGLVEIVGLENVSRLDTGVFGSCSSLTTFTLNPELTEIPDQTFLGCKNLEMVDIPSSVIRIGNKAFEECRLLKSVNLESCESIGERAFYYCNALQKAELSKSLKTVGQYAFYNCTDLDIEEISVSTRINKYAFAQIRGIKKLTLYSPFIDTYAFGYCTNLKTLKIKSGTLLGSNCFYSCTALETCEFEDGTNVIPVSCFAQCSKLDIPFIKVELSINSSGFANTGMTEITIDCPVIGTNAFERCAKLKSVMLLNTTTINNYAFYNCPLLETVIFPEDLEISIGSSAFYSDSNLTAVSIPKLKSIGSSAFGSCTRLKDVVLGSKGNPVTSIHANSFNFCSSEDMKISIYVEDPSVPLANQPWGALNATIEYLKA